MPEPQSPAGPIVLSFDNLGEASELERGTRSDRERPGSHPSVTVALPRLLDELDALELRATFLIEAINCELNPGAVRAIISGGHEIAVHGWQHEPWSELPAARERELLRRARDAFRGLGVDVRGFRPPGGELTERSPATLGELGFEWVSPASRDPEPFACGGLTFIPFVWELVDAYHLMPRFASLRERHGAPALRRRNSFRAVTQRDEFV